MSTTPHQTNHRFLDEAGDTTFYGKKRVPIIGQEGVSACFMLGMVKFRQPLSALRTQVATLQNEVIADSYYADIPSIQKKAAAGGYYFHATDDIPEVRQRFYQFINTIDCSFEAVVARKSAERYEQRYHGREDELYADLLAHLLKNKVHKDHRLVLTIAQRGKTTRNATLNMALQIAKERYMGAQNKRSVTERMSKGLQPFGGMLFADDLKADIVFNVQNPHTDPLLNVADYFCWAIQRVFEKGEMRYYNYLREKISLVIDLDDPAAGRGKWTNYYKPNYPLTAANKISPPLH
ncbi:DUF3800 domain-containing protein [Spirosoma rhododendri]|uniref:DUF3800 domain-containing protein n=1 Tax=Spirosoma rhododendri TaxID=2728024 RepID=A0A7L5DRI0_9BACT|nr:DUF3800 domain-containing protein [Spirosoma rhododendri]QJD79168.1 DUF3800 domain-containing protein [Spirosoma rhododendri]